MEFYFNTDTHKYKVNISSVEQLINWINPNKYQKNAQKAWNFVLSMLAACIFGITLFCLLLITMGIETTSSITLQNLNINMLDYQFPIQFYNQQQFENILNFFVTIL